MAEEKSTGIVIVLVIAVIVVAAVGIYLYLTSNQGQETIGKPITEYNTKSPSFRCLVYCQTPGKCQSFKCAGPEDASVQCPESEFPELKNVDDRLCSTVISNAAK